MTVSTKIPAEKRPERRAPLMIERFRQPLLGVAAGVVMFIGLLLLSAALSDRAGRLAASAGPPPDHRPLTARIAAAEDLPSELAIRAQLDRARAYFVRVGFREIFAAPLYPPQARGPSDPIQAVLFEPEGAPSEAAFANWVAAVGPAGTVVELIGRPTIPAEATRRRLAAAFEAEGLRLAPDALFIDPYHRPRRAELAPSGFGPTFGGAVLAVGALLGLLALRRPKGAPQRERPGVDD